jgi:hypothetical protein
VYLQNTEMNLLTKKDYKWTVDLKGYRFCQIPDQEINLMFYAGVTKILNKGEVTLKDKLVAELGATKGTKKLKEIYNRGTKAHAVLETDKTSCLPAELLTSLGEHLGDEVLVYSTIFNKNIIGFIDAVYRNPNGKLTLVDYKTKSSRYNFIKYNKEKSIQDCFNQLVAYSVLFKILYGQEIEEVKMVTLFLDGKDAPEVFTLNRSNFLPYAKNFSSKIKL